MPNCQELEPLITAWVDDAATAEQREAVETHFRRCPPCQQRAESERSARQLIRTRAPELRPDAPPHLKARCRALCATRMAVGARGRLFGSQRVGLAIAAALLLATTAVIVYGITGASTTILAAQLALDHVKCFVLTSDPGAAVDAGAVKAQLRERYGWTINLPGDSPANELRLLGGRRCLYGEGTIAHILYRHRGVPLSLFVLPNKVIASRIVEVMGHEAVVWAHGARTFVLVGREPHAQLRQIARYMEAIAN